MKKIAASVLAVFILAFLSSCLSSEFDYSANTQSDVLIVTSSVLSDENFESTGSNESSSKAQSSLNSQTSSSEAETSSKEESSYKPAAPEPTSSKPESSRPSENTVTVPDSAETGENLVWVPVNGGTKYHSKPTCSKMKDPIQVTIDTAETNGYTPCKRCY